MRVRFWGVRGSIAVPGPQTVKYGGNTACIEIAFEHTGRRIIVDAGTGIRGLGERMLAEAGRQAPPPVDLFLTHTHLDHIVGLPFFAPLFCEDFHLTVYGPQTFEEDDLESVLGTQLSYRFFPVRQSELAARVRYVNLPEGTLALDDGIRVRCLYLNHSLLCLAYRIEWSGRCVCTAYDTEPFQNPYRRRGKGASLYPELVREGELAAAEANQRLEEFFRGADLLIHDAQYTAAEYHAGRIGWGHTAVEDAIDMAQRAGARRLALFHHDPGRSDAQLVAFEHAYGRCCDGAGPEVTVAREGLEVAL